MLNVDKTVFISYRREVNSYIARAIFQNLREHDYDVFMDVENIDNGTFDTIILNEIAARKHFIVILTPGTEKRMAESEDWLRREIEHAIKSTRNIVPILANNFNFSDSEQYIENELKQLQRFNGINLHPDYFDAAMDRLKDRFLKEPKQVTITPSTKSAAKEVLRKIDLTANLPSPTKAQLKAEDYFDSGLQKHNEENYSQSIEDYDKAIELNPEYVDAYNNRGNAYDDLGEYQQAIEDYDKAIELNPEDPDAYINRGLSYNSLGKYQQATEDYDKAIELNPEDPDAYYSRGLAYNSLGVYHAAIEDYGNAIELNPEYAVAYNNRGVTYGNLDQNQKEIEDYDKAIELNPEYADAYYNRGLAYKNLKNKQKAIFDFLKLLEIGTDADNLKKVKVYLKELGVKL